MRMDSTIAIAMPSSTPKSTTPAVATSDRMSDDFRTAKYRRSTPRSIRDSAAVMTTAASAVCGRSASNEFEEQQQDDDQAGADHSGELALRAGLLGDGSARAARRRPRSPGRSPAAMLAAPIPIIS